MMDQLPFFVYGTLRLGQGNHRIVEADLEAVREARLPGHVLYGDGLPYIAACGDPASIVTGDLLMVRPGQYERSLRALDRLEGYNPPEYQMYVRTRVRAGFRDGPDGPWQECDAWAYLGGNSFRYHPRLVIASGDWAAARRAAWPRRWRQAGMTADQRRKKHVRTVRAAALPGR
jgi:gamma-glutamylcyclotransferase (GGCT)/AIG2-like uncharacterized protein YtfP